MNTVCKDLLKSCNKKLLIRFYKTAAGQSINFVVKNKSLNFSRQYEEKVSHQIEEWSVVTAGVAVVM